MYRCCAVDIFGASTVDCWVEGVAMRHEMHFGIPPGTKGLEQANPHCLEHLKGN